MGSLFVLLDATDRNATSNPTMTLRSSPGSRRPLRSIRHAECSAVMGGSSRREERIAPSGSQGLGKVRECLFHGHLMRVWCCGTGWE
jgi:hypothetical protein